MLVIGKIVGFHGVKGEVKVPIAERLLKNLSEAKQLFVYPVKGEPVTLTLQSYRAHKTNVLVKFKEYSNKNDVEYLQGALIKQKKDLIAPLEEEEYFIDDLIGVKAYNKSDKLLGVVNYVFTDHSSTDMIELKTLDDKLKLIPFVEELVPVVNMKELKIIIDDIPGLIDDEV